MRSVTSSRSTNESLPNRLITEVIKSGRRACRLGNAIATTTVQLNLRGHPELASFRPRLVTCATPREGSWFAASIFFGATEIIAIGISQADAREGLAQPQNGQNAAEAIDFGGSFGGLHVGVKRENPLVCEADARIS